jgi:hypothetical protein
LFKRSTGILLPPFLSVLQFAQLALAIITCPDSLDHRNFTAYTAYNALYHNHFNFAEHKPNKRSTFFKKPHFACIICSLSTTLPSIINEYLYAPEGNSFVLKLIVPLPLPLNLTNFNKAPFDA